MKAKPIKAWAVIKKKKNKITPTEIFNTKDILLGEDEIIIRVEIRQIK
jgi:hypothetical protein